MGYQSIADVGLGRHGFRFRNVPPTGPLPGWPFRKPITIDRTQVPSTQTGVPFVVKFGADADLAAHALKDRRDVRFTDDSGAVLPHEWLEPNPGCAVGDGAWTWFTDPRVICYQGTNRRMFFGAIDRLGQVIGCHYDLDTGATAWAPLRAGILDDHNNPSFIARSDGRIMAFYSRHSQDRLLYVSTTVNPEDASSWTETTLPDAALFTGSTPGAVAYSNPFKLSAEPLRIYLETRIDNHMTLTWTDDNGATWANGVRVITDSPYVKIHSNGVDRVDFLCSEHPDNVAAGTSDVRHMYYSGGSFFKTDGTLIRTLAAVVAGTPIGKSEQTQIYNGNTILGGTHGNGWIADMALGIDGNPVAAWFTIEDATGTSHTHWYSRWNGTAWITTSLGESGGTIYETSDQLSYDGLIALDHSDPRTLYRCRKLGSAWELEKLVTADNGASFTTTAITSSSPIPPAKNKSPVCPRNRLTGAPEVLWMQGRFTTYVDFSTQIRCHPPLAQIASPGIARVKVPSVSSAADTRIWAYYGKVDAGVPVPYAPDADELLRTEMSLLDAIGRTWQAFYGGDKRLARRRLNVPPTVAGRAGAALHGDLALRSTGDYWQTGVAERISTAGLPNLTVYARVKLLGLNQAGSTIEYIAGNRALTGTTEGSVLLRCATATGVLTGLLIVATDTSIGTNFTDLVLPVDGNFHDVVLFFQAGVGLRCSMDGVVSTVTGATAAATTDPTVPAGGFEVTQSPNNGSARGGNIDVDAVHVLSSVKPTDWHTVVGRSATGIATIGAEQT